MKHIQHDFATFRTSSQPQHGFNLANNNTKDPFTASYTYQMPVTCGVQMKQTLINIVSSQIHNQS